MQLAESNSQSTTKSSRTSWKKKYAHDVYMAKWMSGIASQQKKKKETVLKRWEWSSRAKFPVPGRKTVPSSRQTTENNRSLEKHKKGWNRSSGKWAAHRPWKNTTSSSLSIPGMGVYKVILMEKRRLSRHILKAIRLQIPQISGEY